MTTTTIRNTKNQYYKEKFRAHKNDIKKTWETVNEIIGKKKKDLDESLKTNFAHEDPEQIANTLAETFKNNVDNIIHNCDIRTSTHSHNTTENSIYMEETSEEEIIKIIETLNTNKGPGIDQIRAIDLKTNATIMTPIITKLINMSIRQGEIPRTLKTSTVRPLYKNGTKSDPKNYRPISILPTIEKIMEEVVLTRIQGFIDKYKIINDRQFGFQKGKNINQLLGTFTNHLNNNMAKTKHSLILFIDFTKAFDTIPHTKIIDTLYKAGIRGTCIKWIENYLKDRTFRVKIDGKYSNEIKMTHGVPQGSKLGPILYILFTNELLKIIKNCEIFAYADDTAVVVAHKNLDEATKILQDKFVQIMKWCHDNGLIINEKKTKLLHIREPHMNNTKVKIKFHDTTCIHKTRIDTDDHCKEYIEQVEKCEYLGVLIDHRLKWHDHIQKLRTKLRKTTYILRQLSYCSDNSILRQVYYALGESHIRHGITAWGTSTSCKKLQQSQNYMLKILDNNSNKTNKNTDLNKKLNILDIKSIHHLALLNEFGNDSKYLIKIDHDHRTRINKTQKYKIKQHKNNYGKNTLEVQIPTIVNNIPQNIIKNKNVYKRRQEIKKFLLDV